MSCSGRRWVVWLGLSAGVTAALVASFLATPQFRSTTVLQIERQNPAVLDQRDLSKMDQSFLAYSDFYQTQYRIIGSDAVARIAVQELDWPTIRRSPSRHRPVWSRGPSARWPRCFPRAPGARRR